MRRALAEYRIGGIHTTLPFHQKVMDSVVFQWGQFDTSFLDGPDGFRMTAATRARSWPGAAVAAALVEHERGQQAVILGAPCDGDGVRVSPWKLTGRPGNVRTR
jgi:acetyl/propionyl-CoA carboxylase alpha subunit